MIVEFKHTEQTKEHEKTFDISTMANFWLNIICLFLVTGQEKKIEMRVM